VVERHLAKVDVAGSTPVSRSNFSFDLGRIAQPAFGVGAARWSFEGFPSTGLGVSVGVGATRSEEFDFELLTVDERTGLGVGVGSAAKAAEASPKAIARAATPENCLFFMGTGYVLRPC
jgi:hypothetical protein